MHSIENGTQPKFSGVFKLAPYEILALAWCVTSYFILQQLPVTYPILQTAWHTLYSFWRFLVLALVIGIAVALITRVRMIPDTQSDLKKPGYWLEIARISLACIYSLMFHFFLKSSIYLINPRTWDTQLWDLDRAVHLGISPSLFLLELFNSKSFYFLMNIYYSGLYFYFNVIYPVLFIILGSARLRRSFATAYVLLWIVGLALYVVVPSWGPVYTHPEEFEQALQHMAGTVKVQHQLYLETSSLVRNPKGERIIVYGGIAAFPSLHVAVLLIYALTSRSISRKWFHANLFFTFLMVLGAVITGYHYLIDCYAGLLLGWGLFRLAEVWTRHADR